MVLTIGEKLMVIRARKGLKMSHIAKKAFKDLRAGNIKIKKIESGRSKPTEADIEAICGSLDIDVSELDDDRWGQSAEPLDGYLIRSEIFECVPRIKNYFDIMNSAAEINNKAFILAAFQEMCNDKELIKEIKKAIAV